MGVIRNNITIKNNCFLFEYLFFFYYSFDSKLEFHQPLLQSSETCLIIIITFILLFILFFICEALFWVDITNLIEWPFQQNHFVYAFSL